MFNDDAVEGLSFYKKKKEGAREREREKPWFGIKFLEFIFKRLKKMDQEGHSYSNYPVNHTIYIAT